MKKILSILTLLVAFAVQGVANRTIYLSPGVWNVDGARFAVWAWPNTGEGQWVDAELAPNETSIYQVTLPDGIANIIWVRMNGATTENNWDNKWNQTDDIVLGNENLYTITGWGEGKSPYSTGTYTYTIATINTVQLQGNFASTGTDWNAIDLSAVAGEENTWSGTLDLTDFTDDKEFKLVINGGDDGSETYAGWIGTNKMTVDAPSGWVLATGVSDNDNCKLYNSTTGYKTYKITASWEPNSNYAAKWTLKIEGIDERHTYTVVGEPKALFGGDQTWDESLVANEMTESSGVYTWTKENVALSGPVKFKVCQDHAWDVAYPSENYVVTSSQGYTCAGTYNVTITYNPSNSNEVVSATFSLIEAEAPTCYSVVGELTGGWHDNDTEDVEMTLQSSGLYTYEVASFTAEAKGYSYRLRANHKWGVFELPQSGNQVYTFTEAGNYKLTFTANVTGEEIAGVAAYTLTLDVEKIVETNTYTATFDNGGGWTNVYAYAWSGADESTVEQLGAWPGTKIDPISGVYTVTIDAAAAPEKIIFNNGRGIQTADLEFVNEQAYTYSVTVPGTALWSSEEAKAASWYSDPYDIVVSADKFANVKVGDKIHVAVQSVPVVANDWNAQVTLKDGWWHDVEKAVNVGTGNVEIASFTVTGDMLRLFKERGMIVSGTNYSTKLVTYETTAITGSDLSIWVGSQNTNVEINKAHFQNANGGNGVKVGDVIRVTTEAAGWLGLSYNDTDWNWHDFAAGAIEPINDWNNPYVDFVVKTEAAAQILNSDNQGIFVNVGDNPPLTVTQVELITFTGYYLATSESSWTTFTEMTETTEGSGVYTATVSGAGKFFAIVPNTAMTVEEDAIKTWKSVIRPYPTGDFVVDFANYADDTKSNADNDVWKIGATNDAEVTISYTPADGKFTISCETEVEITDGYATYSNAQKYMVEGATANFVTVNSALTEATLVAQAEGAVLPGCGVNTLATGKGVVLSGTGPAKIKSVNLTATAVETTGNMLTGTGDYTFNLNANDYTAYLLQTVNGQTGFQKWNGDTTTPLGAHKAFLAIPNVTAGAPAFISFGGGSATSIDAVELPQRTGQYYTLDGRRVENPTKGLYIINGKKVVIK